MHIIVFLCLFIPEISEVHMARQSLPVDGLPNGLCCAPRIFTKLLKPVYSTLRLKGQMSVGYIDDSYLQGKTVAACRHNITDTVDMFQGLGFIIHPDKSVLVPTKKN